MEPGITQAAITAALVLGGIIITLLVTAEKKTTIPAPLKEKEFPCPVDLLPNEETTVTVDDVHYVATTHELILSGTKVKVTSMEDHKIVLFPLEIPTITDAHKAKFFTKPEKEDMETDEEE